MSGNKKPQCDSEYMKYRVNVFVYYDLGQHGQVKHVGRNLAGGGVVF